MVLAASNVFEIWDGATGSDPVRSNFPKISDFIGVGLNILMGASIGIATIAIIVSGVRFVVSEGDAKQLDQAKRYLSYSIIGFIIGISAFTIKNLILNLLGVTTTELTNETPGI